MEIDMLARVLAHISLAAMAFTPHAGPKDDIGTSQHGSTFHRQLIVPAKTQSNLSRLIFEGGNKYRVVDRLIDAYVRARFFEARDFML